MLVMVSFVERSFFTVTLPAALFLPRSSLPNARLVGAETSIIPSPERLILWVAPAAIVRVPLRVPVCAGVKVTEIVQLALGASVAGLRGQLFVSA